MNLAVYLVLALVAWTHVPALDCDYREYVAWQRLYGESPEETLTRINDIATTLAEEAEARQGSARTALELGAVAYEESRLVPYVDSGECNRHPRAWMTCDHKKAYTPWQFHPDTVADVHRGRLTGAELLASRELQVHIAWALWQHRPQAWTTRLAAVRRARAWETAHPLPD